MGSTAIFLREGATSAKNKYNNLYRKLLVEYFCIRQFFWKKQYFQKKKDYLNPFLGETITFEGNGVSDVKNNYNLLNRKKILNNFSLGNFFGKKYNIFRENQKKFWGARPFLKGNENNLSSFKWCAKYFFIRLWLGKKRYFSRKPILWGTTTFSGKNATYQNFNYNPFHPKLGAKYFFIRLLFREQQYFPRKQWKTILGDDHFCK